MFEKIRVRILDVPVDIINMRIALDYVRNLVEYNDKPAYILAVNAEKIMSLQKDVSLINFYGEASLLLPDGIGVVIAIRLILGMKANRVTGADLVQAICKESLIYGYKIFIFGGREEINKNVVEKLKIKFPGIQIVGRCHGYVSDENINDLINQINEAETDILFIGLGSPKQEKWILDNLAKLQVKVCQAVGGTLDILAGNSKRAPFLIQNFGFEWLFRLLKEPKRIHRQIVYPIFMFSVLKEKLKVIFKKNGKNEISNNYTR